MATWFDRVVQRNYNAAMNDMSGFAGIAILALIAYAIYAIALVVLSIVGILLVIILIRLIVKKTKQKRQEIAIQKVRLAAVGASSLEDEQFAILTMYKDKECAPSLPKNEKAILLVGNYKFFSGNIFDEKWIERHKGKIEPFAMDIDLPEQQIYNLYFEYWEERNREYRYRSSDGFRAFLLRNFPNKTKKVNGIPVSKHKDICAAYCFKLAEDAGLLSLKQDGETCFYQWNKDGRLMDYFLGRIYCKDYASPYVFKLSKYKVVQPWIVNRKSQFPQQELDILFRTTYTGISRNRNEKLIPVPSNYSLVDNVLDRIPVFRVPCL